MVATLVESRRTALGLTQTELAERATAALREMGYPGKFRQNYISDLEQGKTTLPRRHNRAALGKVLGISEVEWLLAAGETDHVALNGGSDGSDSGNIVSIFARTANLAERRVSPKLRAQLEEVFEEEGPEAIEEFAEFVAEPWGTNFELAIKAWLRGRMRRQRGRRPPSGESPGEGPPNKAAG